jgi:membrane protease YdiL (CAAX protease family)
MEAHDLVAFFVLAFLTTFGGWALAIATQNATLFDLGLWGPALAAILITAVTRGKAGLLELARRLVQWRAPARWYLVILLGWPALSLLAALIHALLTGQPLSIQWDNWSATLNFLSSSLILGFWACEEIGWRGFALPRLLGRWNALLSSIVLGLVWWLWHLPYFFTGGGISPEFYPFVALTVTVSIFMTWVFNHTRGSVFLAIFFHFWMNVYDGFQADKLPLAGPAEQELVRYLLLAAAALVIVAVYGYRTLARDRERPATLEKPATAVGAGL